MRTVLIGLLGLGLVFSVAAPAAANPAARVVLGALRPSELGHDPAIESPGSKEFKERVEKEAREKEVREKEVREKEVREKDG